MNRNFFQFPSWVVEEINKQAQPRQVAAIFRPGEIERITTNLQDTIADQEATLELLEKQAITRSEMEGIQAPKRKGRPAGSKNKPKGK